MHISLQSKVYLGTCIAITAYQAYSNPVRWITHFAIFVFFGTLTGRWDLRRAQNGYNPGNSLGMGWSESQDRKVKMKAIASLADSMPGLGTAVIHLVALGLLSQKIQLPSQFHPEVGTCICVIAVNQFAYNVGRLFQLDILCKSPDSSVQQLLANRVI